METKARKPRAKTINTNWAIVDNLDWHWRWKMGIGIPWSRRGRLMALPKHCSSSYMHPEFVEEANYLMLTEHEAPQLKYARKGGRTDQEMGETIRSSLELHAVAEAAKLAAAASQPQAVRKTPSCRL